MSMIKLLGKTKLEGKTVFDTGPAGYSVTDANAISYIAAVEAADGASLEDPVKQAIENFIVGCKSDGIWSAIKASCILAGARTLNGALVPLVGSAPTNYNFVSGDYNRKTGLVGNGSTKYLNSNRNNNADPQNSKHIGIYVSVPFSVNSNFRANLGISRATLQTGASVIGPLPNSSSMIYRANGSTSATISNGSAGGFQAINRSSSTNITSRQNNINNITSSNSEIPMNGNLYVFARNSSSIGEVQFYTNNRLSFYSIGESIDLAKLDTRVSAFMTALNTAI